MLNSEKIYKLENIRLEDTGFFNYQNNQSSVFNRLKKNNIETIKDLFIKYNEGNLDYGKDKLNYNYNITDEVNGIINLIKYKYLKEISNDLNESLDFNINTNFRIYISPYTDRIGQVYHSMIYYPEYHKEALIPIMTFYKKLKSCGFDFFSSKILIDYACNYKINEMSIGDFLLQINLDELYDKYYYKNLREYKAFLNIYFTLVEYYKINIKQNSFKHSI